MRMLVTGFVAGSAVVGLAWWLTSQSQREDAVTIVEAPARPIAEAPLREEPAASPRLAPRRRAEAPEETWPIDEPAAPFAPGEAVLRVGEGYVFGETSARRRGTTDGADIVCLDIGGRVSLRCVSGGRLADTPLGAVGIPADPRAAAELVVDAPSELSPGDVELDRTVANFRAAGVALIRSSAGAAYKVFIVSVQDEKDALRRSVRLGWAEVPQRAGGGKLDVPSATPAAGATTLAELDKIVAAGSALPGASFSNFLHGKYERLSSMPEELVLREGKYLLLDEPLRASVEFNAYSGLVASRGIAPEGRVKIRSYTGVAVRGDMAGRIDVNSYAYVNVSGNLTGKLFIHSYATVVIDGDLIGEVEVSSYTTLLLRGRLAGKLTIRTSNSKFWFQQYVPQGVAEALGAGGGSSNELHLRQADWTAGTHTDITGWKTVVVGEDAWGVIAR